MADTNRMNRAVGLPVAHFQRGEARRGEADVGEYWRWRMRFARWVEQPFEWERPRWFWVERNYSSGPLLRFRGGTELVPLGGETLIRVFSELTPRNLALDPLIRWIVGPLGVRRARQRYQEVVAFLKGTGSHAFPTLEASRSRADVRIVDGLLAKIEAEGAARAATGIVRRFLLDYPR